MAHCARCSRISTRKTTRTREILRGFGFWLDQVEVYFLIVQRKVLAPNDFPDPGQIERCLLKFERYSRTRGDRTPLQLEVHGADLWNVLNRIPMTGLRLSEAA